MSSPMAEAARARINAALSESGQASDPGLSAGAIVTALVAIAEAVLALEDQLETVVNLAEREG